MRGVKLHAGPLPDEEQLMTAEAALALVDEFFAQAKACHTPGSALTRKAAKEAGALETWGPVHFAQRVQFFRAVSHAGPARSCTYSALPAALPGYDASRSCVCHFRRMTAQWPHCSKNLTMCNHSCSLCGCSNHGNSSEPTHMHLMFHRLQAA